MKLAGSARGKQEPSVTLLTGLLEQAFCVGLRGEKQGALVGQVAPFFGRRRRA